MSNDHVWLEGTCPVAVADRADCRDCTWSTSYSTRDHWRSKTVAKAKAHVRATGHKVEYHQTRFGLIKIPDRRGDQSDVTNE